MIDDRFPLTGKECPTESEAWLTVEETAELMGVTPRTVQRWVQSGKLPARKVLQERIRGRYVKRLKPDADEQVGSEKPKN